MKVLSISGLGSEIISAIASRSSYSCSVDAMKKAVNYYRQFNKAFKGTDEAKADDYYKKQAVKACKDFLEVAETSNFQNPEDIKLAENFISIHN